MGLNYVMLKFTAKSLSLLFASNICVNNFYCQACKQYVNVTVFICGNIPTNAKRPFPRSTAVVGLPTTATSSSRQPIADESRSPGRQS
jgi:hypothetical protein